VLDFIKFAKGSFAEATNLESMNISENLSLLEVDHSHLKYQLDAIKSKVKDLKEIYGDVFDDLNKYVIRRASASASLCRSSHVGFKL